MRLILGATRADKKNDGAANFRVYLKPGCQANRATTEMRQPAHAQRNCASFGGESASRLCVQICGLSAYETRER
jgi:hypothetical protein